MDRVEGLAVKAARAGAFSSSKILPVIEEFDKPSFEEFGKMARSLYRLYNSATHIMRDQNPGRQGDAMKALNSVTFPLIKVA